MASKSIVFRTPGHIPVEAFTMVGVNSKPNSDNPIGFFGTGLKYAIAILLRMDCKVTIFIGHAEYVFEVRKEDFRGKEFQFVYLKKRKGVLARWTSIKLPFTLEYGKTWEMWQAYRELHTNTLDENGVVEEFEGVFSIQACPDDGTCIVVEGEAFLQAYYDRYKTFLQEGMRVRNSTDSIQIIDKPSKHIYYRGMRVYDLPEKTPSRFTYNFLKSIELTEDRTAKYMFLLERDIAEHIIRCDDKSFIQEIVRLGTGYWEGKMDFRYANAAPSQAFRSVARMPYAASHPARAYYTSHTPAPTEIPLFTLRQLLKALVYAEEAESLEFRKVIPEGTIECAKKYIKGEFPTNHMTLDSLEETF